MSITYTPTTNFGAKDSLPANDPAKVIKGAEFTTEYTAIQSAFALAAPAASPTFTGTATFDDVSVTNGLTVDTDTLVVDDTNNRVGIGTSSPFAPLDVKSTTDVHVGIDASGGDALLFTATDAAQTAAVPLKFQANSFKFSGSSEFMRIDSSGRVLIAHDAAKYGDKLEVTANGDGSTIGLFGRASDGNSSIRFRANAASTEYARVQASDSNALSFHTGSSGTERARVDSSGNLLIGGSSTAALAGTQGIGVEKTTPGIALEGPSRAYLQYVSGTTWKMFDSTLGVDRLALDASGNFGINTTSPGATLDVRGTMLVVGASGVAETTLIGGIAGVSNGYQITKDASNNLTYAWIRGNGSEAMRVDSSGNLLVGRNSLAQNGKLEVEGLAAFSGGIVAGSGTGGVGFPQNAAGVSIDPNGRINLRRDSNGLAMAYSVGATDSGGISITYGGTPSFSAPSDERLKENITDHESELANVMALRPVRWDWKANDNSGEGFIAQELQETAWADLVSEGDDGMLQVSGLGAVETRLIKAMQEQQALIEELKAEVEALKNA